MSGNTIGNVARIAVAVAIVVGAQAGVLWLERSSQAATQGNPQTDLDALPLAFDRWSGEDVAQDARLNEAVGALDLINRVYRDDAGHTAAVHVAAFSSREFSMPHPPTLCYPNAGWETLSSEEVDLGAVAASQFDFRKPGDRVAVYNWYQMGADAARGYDELRALFQRLRTAPGPRPYLVKVMIQVPPRDAAGESPPCLDLAEQIRAWLNNYR